MRFFLIVLLFAGLPLSLAADEQVTDEAEVHAREGSQVVVRFVHPDELTDLKVRRQHPQQVRAEFARAIQDWFRGPGSRLLGDKQLEIDFIDVEMAGEIQPWRTQWMHDIRYVKPLFPARLVFDYRVLDAQGNELAADRVDQRRFPGEGVRASRRYQPFQHEVAIIADWWRRFDRLNG